MIISYSAEGAVLYGKNDNLLPHLQTSGCSCCSKFLPVTLENLDLAKKQAREWMEELESITPIPEEQYEK